MITGFVGPLHQLQAGTGKNIAKTGFFPFAWVVEAKKIKVPDVCFRRCQRIRLDNGIRWAFDASLNTERAQQMPHKGRLARTQITLQFNQRIVDRRLARQPPRENSRGSFV